MNQASTARDVPSLLSTVLTVASLSFRESARNRVLHALITAMLLVSVISYVFAWVSGGDVDSVRRLKIVADLSLSALSLLGTIASIFLGTNLIYQEVEHRTVYTVLARPIGRGGFIVGKYLGLAGVMGVAVFAMGVGFLLIYMLGGGSPSGPLLLAIVYTYLELTVVIAVALVFSAAAHPIEGALFAFIVALAGHTTASLTELTTEVAKQAEGVNPLLVTVADKLLYGLYVLLPNLENFNIRAEAIYEMPLDAGQLAFSVVYAFLYISIMLALASLSFRRRVL